MRENLREINLAKSVIWYNDTEYSMYHKNQ
jgi:hypothetical protein